jgi:serine/threonine-protein kinase
MSERERSILLRLEADGKEAPRVQLKGTAGTPLLEQIDLRRSGQFEILGELAQGGVGEVMRGRDIDLGRDVALKMLRASHLDNPELIQRFMEEAQIGGQLQHPGIVPVYELGLDGGRPFFAMKLVKGHTLAARLKDREDAPGDRRRFLQVYEQLCQTVAYAHSRGVVHRDLKPSNVMVGAFGEVQVLDWGFAKVLRRGGIADERPSEPEIDVTKIATVRSGEGSESLAGSVMGTPAYMPPEQALGQVELLNERSDVFSLGAILCEILTGKPPYVGDDLLVQAAQGLLDDARQRLDASDGDPEMVALAKQCLEPLRKKRPRDASVVAARVQDHLASVEERAHRAVLEAARAKHKTERALAEAAEQGRARRQSLVLAVSLLLALLIGGGSYLWIEQRQRERVRRTSAAVALALQEAQDHRGAERWAEARTAAGRAVELARAEGVDEATRGRAEQLLSRLSQEAESAEAAARQASREREFVARLEEVRMMRGDAFAHVAVDREYLAAFAERGLDVEQPDAAARVRRAYPGVLLDLAATLDEWSWIRRTKEELEGSDWRVIADLAKAIDPDPWRDKLRDAMASSDIDALREMAAHALDRNLPLRSLDLLGVALSEAGDREAAAEWLETLHRDHAGDFWVNFHLGVYLRDRPQGNQESLPYLEAAVTLRPRSGLAYERLANRLQVLGRPEEALPYAREAVRLVPDSGSAHTGLAIVLANLLRLDEALKEHAAALRLERENPEHRLHYARTLGKMGRFDDAADVYRELLSRETLEARALLGLGFILREQGRLEEALARLDQALRLDPEHMYVRLERGRVLKEMGRLDDATAALKEAERLAPRRASAIFDLGWAYQLIGEPEGAKSKYRETIRLNPRYAEAHVNLAILLMKERRLVEAEGECRTAIRYKPALWNAHNVLGGILEDQERFDEAIEAFEEAIRLAPQVWRPHSNLANLCMKTGRSDRAIEICEEAIRLDARNVNAHGKLAYVYKGLGKFDEAIESYRDLIKLDPDRASVHNTLGALLHDRKRDVDGALRAFRDAVRLGPRNPMHHYNLGIASTSKGDLKGAITAYREAVRLDPRHADAFLNLINLLRREGDLEGAIEIARASTRRMPKHYLGYAALAIPLLDRGDLAGAEANLRRSLELNPRNGAGSRARAVESHSNLGAVLSRQRRPDEAIEQYKKALALDPRAGGALINWGVALSQKGDDDGAIAKYREAIQVEAARAHFNLGLTLAAKGELREAAAVMRVAARASPGGSPQRRYAEMFERAVEVEPRLEAVLAGKERPADAEEKVAFALLALNRDPRIAVRLYAEAFAEDDSLSEQPWFQVVAALRAAAKDNDGATWRARALGWMRERLRAERERATTEPVHVIQHLFAMRVEYALAPVRDDLAALPESEREQWRAFWAEVGALLDDLRRRR